MKTHRALPLLKDVAATAAAIPCLLLLLAAPATVQAQPLFGYTTNVGSTSVTITNYTGPGGAVIIPTTINGLTVTAIGQEVFLYNYNLSTVTIPNTVASIGYEAFYDSSLTSVTIGANVTYIGQEAFFYCLNLTSVYFQGNAPTVGEAAFQDDAAATVYYLPGTTGWGPTFAGLTAEAGAAPLTFANLHSFSVFPNGSDPVAGMVQGSDGNFYGTTSGGGTNGGGYGTVFKVTSNDVVTVLYEFSGRSDGANPQAGLVQNTNDGNFYGTTRYGGTNGKIGTVFKITTNGMLTSLYSFTGGDDGAQPEGALALGDNGTFYGTTQNGGSNGHGNVFQITMNGQFSTLYAFGLVEQTNVTSRIAVYRCGTNIFYHTNYYTNHIALDGATPNGLVLGLDGNLYGTTQSGGASNNGIVFKITTNATLTSLYSFTGSVDGANPQAALVQGSNGGFYGTTAHGGANGSGTVFKIKNDDTYTSLYSFTGGDDGANPQAALVHGINGGFYGTTFSGGDNGYGTVFKITTNGTLTSLYSFTNGIDGANPQAALAQASDGNFYGTATGGGSGIGSGGNGTVFKIATNGTFTALCAFPGANDGQFANAMVHGSDGSFYGTTQNGGTNGAGNVFQIMTNGTLTSLYSFTGGNDGSVPGAVLVQGSDGNFYGTTQYGGDNYDGTIFQVTTNGTLTTLYSFTGGDNGADPDAALVQGGNGSFYGTTPYGGANGDGTVFQITADGQFSPLYAFGSVEQLINVTSRTNVNPCGTTNISYSTNYIALDGITPNGLVPGLDGNFYGTTQYGGTNDNGTVFEITPQGTFTSLYSFTGGDDGGIPYTSLVQGVDGNFYGTTSSQGGGDEGNGTVFEITPNGLLTTLYSFIGDTDGYSPSALLAGTDGNFYGTTQYGGTNYAGNVFQIMTNGTFNNLYSFTGGADGGSPQTALVQGGDGSLYGTTSSGATGGYGGVFSLSGSSLPSPLPLIIIQPSNPPPTLTGLSAAFTVVAFSGAPLSYQWLHNGVPLSAGDDFSGLDLGTLTVDAAAPGDAGTYSVVVSNSYGVTNSSNAVLTLLADTNAMEDFEAGTNYVAAGDYALANLSFANALSFSPTNATNIFFYAATELLSLPQQPAGSNFLNRIGIGSDGRDIFNWQAQEPTNANGHLEVPVTTPPLNADEFTAQLYTNVLPAIVAAQGNLAQITDTNFTVYLTTNETHAGAVTVDWGDVQMLQAMCDTAQLYIYTINSWNLDVPLAAATNVLGQDRSFEAFLTNFPNALTTASTADLPLAKGAFINAINEYFIASQFIRDRQGETRLFNLDTNRMQDELKFRETLSNLLASLSGPVPLTANPAYSVSARAFFSGNFNLRSYLPEFQGDDFVWDTFPDTSFGGIITGLTEKQVGKGFLKHPFHVESVLGLPGTSLSVLYNFTNYSGQSGLVQGPDGNLYGTLALGGPYIDLDLNGLGFGSVFQVTTNGQFTNLYNFGTQQDEYADPLDGSHPNALVLGSDGNLYGTTADGGANSMGTVFKITTSGQLTTLYSFGTITDQFAHLPAAALVQGADGLFYGTTQYGGGTDRGAGTIFAISTNGDFTNLYSFSGYSDGGYPAGAALVQGTNGQFYGTTPQGGEGDFGYGTIFMIDPSQPGQISTLYSFGTQQDEFGDPLDGATPNGLVQGADGNLYGTTVFGGANDDSLGQTGFFTSSGLGDGTLFRISPVNAGSFTTLFSFDENFSDGYYPIGSLLPGPGGAFYGVAAAGGANQLGAIFIFNPNGTATNLVWLTKSSGGYGGNSQFVTYRDIYYYGYPLPPPSLLTPGLDGNLYGTTTDDGTHGSGTVYALNLNVTNNGGSLGVTLTAPSNGQSFSAPANITLSATVANGTLATAVGFYSGTTLLGQTTTSPYSISFSNLAAGTYAFTAVATNYNGLSVTSAVAYVTVNSPGTTLIDFDPLADIGPVEGDPALADYLEQYGIRVTNNSPGTTVVAENQANAAGGEFVTASSPPNLLTQIGSNGPVRFTVSFANPLTQFSFTRPELLANPFVTHPAWQAQAFDALGQPLDTNNEPQISSSTNVPAQTYTLTNTLTGGGIASVEFSSEGTGLTTFNAMLLDDFDLTAANAGDLPPSILITNPTYGQVFRLAAIPISAETATGIGTVTGVNFYYNGTPLTNSSSPFSIVWNAPSNGAYVLTAVAVNSSGLSSTSAPVPITVATGFAIETPPLSQTIAVSNKATFSVTTTETNVSYQWRFNGTSLAGATLSSYTVSNAPISAAGSYTVVASYGGQSVTSPPAVLTVLGPPTLGSPSVATNGGNIILSVSASDSVPFYYQWQLNGNGIPGAANSCLPGTTNISYTITNARPFNSGNYEVVVANAVASEESPSFNVAVGLGAPITTNDNFASSLTIGPLTNGAGVAGINSRSSSPPAHGPAQIAGKPAAGFLWYNWTASFTGVISLTTRGSSFDTLLGVYTGSYPGNLTSVAEDDDSGGFFTSLVSFNCTNGTTYQIVVAGYQGATGSVVLELSPGPPLLPGPANGYSIGGSQPVITQQPVNQLVHAGATVTLSVTASGATSYQWYFADVPVAGGNANTLIISNFLAGAVGNYYVKAANGVGSVQSKTVAIELQNPAQTAGTQTNLLVDKFGDAVDLTGTGAPERYRPEDGGGDTAGYTLSQSFSTAGATKEEGEPNHAGQPGGASYWYSYTSSYAGSLLFDTAGSTFNTILAVYIGPGNSFSTLTNVGSDYTTNYGQTAPAVTISNVVAGTKYFIAIDGYLGASGAAHLNVFFNPPANVNVIVNTNAVPITNNTPVIAITSPANNYLTMNSNITVRGTVKGSGGKPPVGTFVQVAVNTNAPEQATLQGINWSTNVTLTNGANTITAQGITVLGTNTNTVFASAPVTRTIFYDVTPPSPLVKTNLTLLTSPPGHGKITGQANQARLEINKVYTVTAVPIGNWVFANWSSGTNTNSLSPLPNSASLSFLMSSNLILQANFVTNPFTAVAGVYNGLFSPTNGVSEESSGFFTATLPVAGRGTYSAKLLLDGGSYPFSGTFDLSGDAEEIVARSGKTSLTVDLHLDLPATNDPMTGSVSDNATNAWISELRANRAVFNAKSNPAADYAGKYTLIIPPGSNAPTNEPGGYGYATLANTLAGLVSLSGRLADNTAISQSVAVSKDGNIPLYVSLYSRRGLLLGWLVLTNDTTNQPAQMILGTSLAWIKTNIPKTLYAPGFTNTNITVLGSLYIPPASRGNALTLTNGTLTIGNGGLADVLIYSNLTIAGDKLVNTNLDNPTNQLKGVITPGAGIFTVTFRPTGVHTDTVAKGVVLQDDPTTNAAGWFLGADQSGYFLLQQ